MKIPIEVQKIKDPDGVDRFRAVISLQDAIVHAAGSQELIRIQREYTNFIEDCKTQLRKIQSGRKFMSNSKLQWKLAHKIYSFIKSIENNGYLFANMAEAITRDVGLSKSQLNYLIRFRTYYPTINQVQERINWSKYREILDINDHKIRELCKEKILTGELTSDHDIRIFKARYRTKSV